MMGNVAPDLAPCASVSTNSRIVARLRVYGLFVRPVCRILKRGWSGQPSAVLDIASESPKCAKLNLVLSTSVTSTVDVLCRVFS